MIAFAKRLLAAILLSLVAAQGKTSDHTHDRLPAAACQAVSGARDTDLDVTVGGIRNVSDKAISVTCPVVRHAALRSGVMRAQVYGYHPYGASEASRCFLVSRYWSTHRTVGSGPASTGDYQLHMAVPHINRHSTFVLECRLPPGARLTQYYVDEMAL